MNENYPDALIIEKGLSAVPMLRAAFYDRIKTRSKSNRKKEKKPLDVNISSSTMNTFSINDGLDADVLHYNAEIASGESPLESSLKSINGGDDYCRSINSMDKMEVTETDIDKKEGPLKRKRDSESKEEKLKKTQEKSKKTEEKEEKPKKKNYRRKTRRKTKKKSI
jgi:hypothetical protein